jgi:hypothetical protein
MQHVKRWKLLFSLSLDIIFLLWVTVDKVPSNILYITPLLQNSHQIPLYLSLSKPRCLQGSTAPSNWKIKRA